jgi:hypothetical protein
MINNMTFTGIAKKWWVCWYVTFQRAAWKKRMMVKRRGGRVVDGTVRMGGEWTR